MTNNTQCSNEVSIAVAVFLIVMVFLIGIAFTWMGLDIGGPRFTAFTILVIYLVETVGSSLIKRGELPKSLLWGSWTYHLCFALALLGYLYYTGYIDTGYSWEEELGHGNFDYHEEPASCWNIFWWLAGIRLTILQIFHLWRHR